MIYHHPLAYLVGLEGLALLRGWAGDFDQEFVEDRIAEVRRLLDDPGLSAHPGVAVALGDTATGYRQWAESYDGPPRNGLFDFDEPVVNDILDGLPVGTVLDAGCGTGRFAEGLAMRGHQVIGVDSSPEMLAQARHRVPGAGFILGELDRLPIPDDSVDLVVCALALSHLPSLDPVMRDFARVLRPGGHLVISDTHHELIFRGSVVKAQGPNGEPSLVPTYRHTPGAFLRSVLPLGFQLRRFEEPGAGDDREAAPTLPDPVTVMGPWAEWPWTLMDLVPSAAQAACNTPCLVIWHFQLMPS